MADTLLRSKHAMPRLKGASVEFMVVVIPQNSCVMIFLLIIHRVTLARRGLLERKGTWQVFISLSDFHLFIHMKCFSIHADSSCKRQVLKQHLSPQGPPGPQGPIGYPGPRGVKVRSSSWWFVKHLAHNNFFYIPDAFLRIFYTPYITYLQFRSPEMFMYEVIKVIDKTFSSQAKLAS